MRPDMAILAILTCYLFYQVMVLNSVFVDCGDRVISWSVHEDDPFVSSVELLPLAAVPPLVPPAPGGQRSLMAPVEGSIDSLFCTNDLQSLFELAEVLYRVSRHSYTNGSLEHTSRASQVVSVHGLPLSWFTPTAKLFHWTKIPRSRPS